VDPISLILGTLIFSNPGNPMIVFSDSRDPIWVSKKNPGIVPCLKKNPGIVERFSSFQQCKFTDKMLYSLKQLEMV